MSEPGLVPGRSCGTCNVCCVALTIDDPELQKVQGFRCKNALRDNSCAIYDRRPQTCRDFNCGWRRLKWVREPLRPDTSGVLVRLQEELTDTGATSLGIIVTLLTQSALRAEGLAETIAAAIAANIPVYLDIPGPPGHTSSTARMNEALTEAVSAKNKSAILNILRQARAQGRSENTRPVVLARKP